MLYFSVASLVSYSKICLWPLLLVVNNICIFFYVRMKEPKDTRGGKSDCWEHANESFAVLLLLLIGKKFGRNCNSFFLLLSHCIAPKIVHHNLRRWLFGANECNRYCCKIIVRLKDYTRFKSGPFSTKAILLTMGGIMHSCIDYCIFWLCWGSNQVWL